jgi:hypothetical protein
MMFVMNNQRFVNGGKTRVKAVRDADRYVNMSVGVWVG